MTARELHRQAIELGLRLEPAGDRLAVIPKGRCPRDFADVLREHKRELLEWLKSPPCPGWQSIPPESLALNPSLPTPTPVHARRVMEHTVRQIGNALDPLCEWCLKRELAYWEQFHWPDELCAYAAARDVACWQLRRPESEVWELLEGFEGALALRTKRAR